MNGNFYSPNSKPLDNKLIRDVVLRARTPQCRKGRSSQQTYVSDLNPTMSIPTPFDGSKLSSPKPTSTTNRSSSTTTPNVDMMRLVETGTGGSSGVDTQNFMAAAEALIRQRRRIQQRQYRNQQLEYTENLTNDVRKMREEIKSLEQQLQYTSIGLSKSHTLWGVATDYFRLFRHGFRPSTDAEYACALKVLEASMAPNVRDGLVCGSKGVLTRWITFSLCFDNIFVDLQRLEKGPVDNSAVATVTTCITISTDSLRLVFPHLTQEGKGSRNTCRTARSLAAKLLGQRLIIRGSVTFEWDATIGLVSRLQSQSDMLTPLLQILDNLEDVNRVFEGSLVSPERSWPQALA